MRTWRHHSRATLAAFLVLLVVAFAYFTLQENWRPLRVAGDIVGQVTSAVEAGRDLLLSLWGVILCGCVVAAVAVAGYRLGTRIWARRRPGIDP